MTVIAMTREIGSLGKDIAYALARELQFEIMPHELVEQKIADRMGAPASTVHRLLEGHASLFERWKMTSRHLARHTAEEILERAARGGVVIWGWGAVALLRPVSHVICVRVCAPMAFRMRVLMERLEITDAEIARREIDHGDAAHATAMKQLFAANREDPLLYDIVLNTARIPSATCVEQLKHLAQFPQFQETDESREILAKMLMETRTRSTLEQGSTNALSAPFVEIAADSSTLSLRGVTSTEEAIALVEQRMHGANSTKAARPSMRNLPPIRW